MLPEPSQHEFITTSLTSPSPMFNTTKTDLDTMMCTSPRYPDNNTYYPNNWGANSTYPSTYNNYYTAPNNNQQYNSTPTMVLYPSLYSTTVNQNQIHLHLHNNAAEKLDQYVPPDVLSGSRGILELGAPHQTDGETQPPQQIEEVDRAQTQSVTDPSSVWRPY